MNYFWKVGLTFTIIGFISMVFWLVGEEDPKNKEIIKFWGRGICVASCIIVLLDIFAVIWAS